jgi:DNA replication protein DnaC
MTPSDLTRLDAQLHRLQLHHIQSHYQAFATKAAEQQCSHLDYLAQLVEGEAAMRENRGIERRIKNARFPVLKSLDDFQWSWPKKINRPQIQNLFRLAFVGHSVLFTTAVDIINTLAAAQARRRPAVPDHQPALRTRADRDHLQSRLQALVPDLQQRQHVDLRDPRPCPAPRRHGHH